MAMGAWLVLAGVCLLHVALGVWAVAQIFPADRSGTHPPDPGQGQGQGAGPHHESWQT